MHATRDGATVLDGVNLRIQPGEAVCVIGANGAGKSTLMRSVSGLLRPVTGSIRLGGAEIGRERPDTIVKRGIALVPEGRQVFSPLTVLENLRMGAYMHRHQPRGRTDNDLARILDIFPKLVARLRQAAGTLSGGEQQMLAIARALMSRPRLLLLDEPSLGLAPLVVESLFGVIEHLVRDGTAVLLAEQNARAAFRVCTRGYVLEGGHVVLQGETGWLAQQERLQSAYLG
ncbi:ABC transporter ATP-binding protein [Paraburkholderia unamae]|uniref:ABC transporter ATP-binding protein n=1 Tax=Paraburkholderia unamae TaxID=219649 RepID=UPI001CC805FD|nr:ABC transporter ATP-binding protein [Paraburkholderia unamae]